MSRLQFKSGLGVDLIRLAISPGPSPAQTRPYSSKLKVYPRLYPKPSKLVIPSLEQTVKQALDDYQPAIVLTQVGSFYEVIAKHLGPTLKRLRLRLRLIWLPLVQSYFEQAKQVSKLLSLKLTSKSFNKQRVPSCGFTINQLDRHIKTLIDQAYSVVILNEFKQPNSIQIERKVVRVVSPGTALEHASSDDDNPNYLVAIGYDKRQSPHDLALVYKDLSTGASFSKLSTVDALRDELLLIEPSEVVYDPAYVDQHDKVWSILNHEQQPQRFTLSKLPPTDSLPGDSARSLVELGEIGFGRYVDRALGEAKPRILETESQDQLQRMILDPMTIKSLELRESSRGTSTGSLIHLIKRTQTPAGARLLRYVRHELLATNYSPLATRHWHPKPKPRSS